MEATIQRVGSMARMGKEGGAKETESALLLGIRLSYIDYYLVIGRECRNAQENENCFRVWSVEKKHGSYRRVFRVSAQWVDSDKR